MTWKFILALCVSLFSQIAWSDCLEGDSPQLDQKQIQEAKFVTVGKKYGDGFYHLFKIKEANFYLAINYMGGMSGEPVFDGGVFKVEGGKTTYQCLDVFGIGRYEFLVTKDKKGFVIIQRSGCNDHSGEDCKPKESKYSYKWDGQKFN